MICPSCGNANEKRIYVSKSVSDAAARTCLDCKHSWGPNDDVDINSVKKKGSYREHQEIMGRTSLITQSAWPNSFFCERHVGAFLTLRGNRIQVGLPGQADAYLMLPCQVDTLLFHVHIEIEFKSGSATLSIDQRKWRREIMSKGGLYITIRKPEDIVSIIEKKYGAIICKNLDPIN
jgi:hypothetical protein